MLTREGILRWGNLKGCCPPLRKIKFFLLCSKSEKHHKLIKQNTSIEKSPTKVMSSQSNYVFVSIVAYGNFEFFRTKTLSNHFAVKYKMVIQVNQAAFKRCEKIISTKC